MQVRRFFCATVPPVGGTVALPEAEARHALRVLRLQPGDRLQLLDGCGTRAEALLVEAQARKELALCQIETRQEFPRPVPAVQLLVAPPRGKVFDSVLRSAVELGVAGITPVLCRYGVARPDAVSDNWLAVLQGAAKQSLNPWLPMVDEPLPFAEALAQAPRQGYFGAVPRGGVVAAAGLDGAGEDGLAVWIGPEGGFSADEEDALFQSGYQAITVGRWILRVETAVPALLGYITLVSGRNSSCAGEFLSP